MAKNKDEFSRMQELTFGKKLLKEEKETLNKEQLDEHALGIVGTPAINNPLEREKTNYELAFEHFLGERYEETPKQGSPEDINDKFNKAVKGDKKPKGKNELKEEFSLDQLLLRIKANVDEFLARGGDLEALEGILKMSVKSYE